MDTEQLSTVIRNANPIKKEFVPSVDGAWLDLVTSRRRNAHGTRRRTRGSWSIRDLRRRPLLVSVAAVVMIGVSTVIGVHASTHTTYFTNPLARAFGVVNANAATSSGFTATPSSPQGFNVMTCPTSRVCYVESTNFVGGSSSPTSVTKVFKSVDGGTSWKSVNLPTTGNPDTPFACSSVTVCSVGVQTTPPGAQKNPWDGTSQSIFTTIDGGSSWTSHIVTINPVLGGDSSLDTLLQNAQGSWNQLQCFNALTCIAVALTPSDQPQQPFAGDPSVAGVLRSVVMRTSDGGSSWSSTVIPWSTAFDGSPGWSNAQEMTLACPSQTSCVGLTTVFHSVVDNSQTSRVKVWRSHDGGATWRTHWMSAPVEASGRRLTCPTDSDCYATVSAGPSVNRTTSQVVVTHNGGESWAVITPMSDHSGLPLYEYNSVSCTNASSCWVSGEILSSGRFGDGTSRAAIWATSDSGASWVSVPLASGLGFVSQVTCHAPDSCLALAGPPYKSGQSIPQGPLPGEILSNQGD